MLKSSNTKRLALSVAVMAAAVTPLFAGSASADPKQLGALVGVGSDTTQDVLNAMAGNSNNVPYTPITSSSASGARQVISFDATPPVGVADNCISPKVGGPTFDRPNGSTNGRAALSRALDGTKWGSAACGGLADLGGIVDFARSSSGPASGDTGTTLTYVPFGRDAVSFAYYRAGGAGGPVTSLTRPQLTTLFTTGTLSVSNGIESVNIIACGIQTGSGTFKFWNTVTTASTSLENTATTTCNNLGGTGRLQENDAAGLKAKGDLAASGTQVVVGFSAANFVAKSNGVADGNPAPLSVGLGSISDNGAGVNLGSPISGSAPNVAANATFYNSSIFGRNVYNVLPSAIISGGGNFDIKTMFVGSTSAVCSANAVIVQFGYLSLGAGCGTTTTKGSLIAGQVNA